MEATGFSRKCKCTTGIPSRTPLGELTSLFRPLAGFGVGKGEERGGKGIARGRGKEGVAGNVKGEGEGREGNGRERNVKPKILALND